MFAVALSEIALTELKRALIPYFPSQKSAHLSEALAFGLGFSTNAALLAFRRDRSDFPDFAVMYPGDFLNRIEALSDHSDVRPKHRDWIQRIGFEPLAAVRPIASTGGRPLATDRIIRRDLQGEILAAATNEGIRLKLFSLVPGDNRWAGTVEHGRYSGEAEFPFRFGNYHGYARISDAGFAELNIHAAVSTIPLERLPLQAKRASAEPAIVARAGSWIERERGHWIMDASDKLYVRESHRDALLGIQVRAAGFAKRGSFIM